MVQHQTSNVPFGRNINGIETIFKDGYKYLGFPVVETVMQLGIDLVNVVVITVGSESDEAEAHER